MRMSLQMMMDLKGGSEYNSEGDGGTFKYNLICMGDVTSKTRKAVKRST